MKVDTKLVNLALGLFPSSMNAQSPVLPPLLFQFPDNKHLGSEYVMVQVLGSLPPTWGMWTELLLPGFGLPQPHLLKGLQTNKTK